MMTADEIWLDFVLLYSSEIYGCVKVDLLSKLQFVQTGTAAFQKIMRTAKSQFNMSNSEGWRFFKTILDVRSVKPQIITVMNSIDG